MSEALIVRRGGSGGGGGAGGLNFTVKAYSSVPTGTAKENTIGVVTDTSISGWIMQAEQPDGVPGLVWIEVAAASDVAFYADSKGMVKLYPKAVKQYVSGAWESKDAFIYQSGWRQFAYSWGGELFNAGDEFEWITGGWVTPRSGNKTISGNIMLLNNSHSLNVRTANAIDMTGYTQLNVSFGTVDKRAGFALLSPSQLEDSYFGNSSFYGDSLAIKALTESISNSTLTLDISGINQAVYVLIGGGSSSGGTIEISKVWME